MNMNEIRMAILHFEDDDIRKVLLNSHQVSQLHEIYDYSLFTSAKLAFTFDISVQNASSRLRRFHQAGYLTKDYASAETGGIECVYGIPKWTELGYVDD